MKLSIHNNDYSYEETITDDTDISVLNIGLLNAELTDLQLDKVCQSIKTPKNILPVETGLGKTYIQVGIINTLLPLARLTKKKLLLVVPNNKVIDYTEVVRDNISCNYISSTGVNTDVNKLIKNWDNVEIIITTPATWASIVFATHIYNNRNKFLFLGYDEANGINDAGYLHFLEVARLTDYVSLSNATPISATGSFATNSDKLLLPLYNLLYGIGAVNSTYPKFSSTYIKNAGYNYEKKSNNIMVDTEALKRDFGSIMINANRSDVGVETLFQSINFHQCIPTALQYNALSRGIVKQNVLYCGSPEEGIPFSPTTISALSKLLQLLMTMNPQDKKIIYVKNTATITGLYTILTTMGYNVLILDGQTTNTEQLKHNVEKRYESFDGGMILLTTLIRGSNFGSASNVIAYDFPADLMQYIARAARGYKQKVLTLDIIYYPEFDKDTLFGSLLQIKTICSTLDRETQVLPAILQELRRVYPDDSRLNSFREL